MKYKINCYTIEKNGTDKINEVFASVAQILQNREKEISVNPKIIIDYPDLTPFLDNPVLYIHNMIALNTNISQIVILTTYSDKLSDSLLPDHFQYEGIRMPAGPEHTGIFTKQLKDNTSSDSVILYIELVNESDEKIRPSVVLTIENSYGEILGGVTGSTSQEEEGNCAYLSIMAVQKGLPKGTGTMLLQELVRYWEAQNIRTISLGTQTAATFYLKNKFQIIKTIVPSLRILRTDENTIITQDLVIMEYKIK